MKKEILFMLTLLSFSLYSQNSPKDTVYVIINKSKNKNLFIFEKYKNSQYATIKVFNKKNQINNNSNITKIYPKPSVYNYTDYYSIHTPKYTTSIKNLKSFTIEDLSKNQVKRTNNQVIIFIEKLNDYSYNLWTMELSFQE